MSALTPLMQLPPPEPVYRISVAQYHEMIRQGVLREGEPVEMIEGVLVPKMTKCPPHTFATQALRDLLPALLPPGAWFVNDQEPMTTVDSEPEPDVCVARGRRRDYAAAGRHPGPQDMGLVIEVAESSLPLDRGAKRRAYARAAIVQYWIVNLVDRRVEVYTDPSGPGDSPAYRQQQDYPAGTSVPVVLDGHEAGCVRVDDLLL